jgi:2'-5' RNA ligase/ribosomal protein S30
MSTQRHTGAAVVLPCAADLAARLVLPEGERADDLHVTLAYLGDAAALDAATRDALRAELAAVALDAAPIAATLGGVGRFSGDAEDALYLSVDAAGLAPLREAVLAACERAGAPASTEHGFVPHLTLAYLAPDDESPYDRAEPVRCGFDRLALWLADERVSWRLAGDAAAQLAARAGAAVLGARELPADFPPSEIRLFERGWTETTKGRFLLDDEALAMVLAAFDDHGVELAIDFDHGTFLESAAKKDTAGWIGALEARDDGLWATKIRWTEKGLAAIRPGVDPETGAATPPEYRYHSPALQFDEATRRVTRLEPLGLVTFPASKGQRPLVMTASTARGASARTEKPMKRTQLNDMTDEEKLSKRRARMTSLLSKLGVKLADDEDPDEEKLAQAEEEYLRGRARTSSLLSKLGVKLADDAPLTDEVIEEAVGAIEALVEAAQVAQQEIAEAEEREQLLATARKQRKLTPALEAEYASMPLARLRGRLRYAERIVPLANATPPSAARLSGGSKSYAELSNNERVKLAAEAPELFARLRADYLASL